MANISSMCESNNQSIATSNLQTLTKQSQKKKFKMQSIQFNESYLGGPKKSTNQNINAGYLVNNNLEISSQGDEEERESS